MMIILPECNIVKFRNYTGSYAEPKRIPTPEEHMFLHVLFVYIAIIPLLCYNLI